MSDILSLSKARKARQRAAQEQQAQQNRVLFGQTKAQKALKKAQDALTFRQVEAHKLSGIKDD
jgi:Domain of unknown function (DUF4169)